MRFSTASGTGPSASRGIRRVSSRACTAMAPFRSSTRSESNVLRTVQSTPPPISDATSLGVSTTESGPPDRASEASLVWADATAAGVGAPTAVSVTGGSAVPCGPIHRDAVRRIGSRNTQAASSASARSANPASFRRPLRQPFTMYHLIHRPALFERAAHQIQGLHHHRFLEPQRAERAPQRVLQLRLAGIVHLPEELERQVDAFGTDPLHRKRRVPEP